MATIMQLQKGKKKTQTKLDSYIASYYIYKYFIVLIKISYNQKPSGIESS